MLSAFEKGCTVLAHIQNHPKRGIKICKYLNVKYINIKLWNWNGFGQ